MKHGLNTDFQNRMNIQIINKARIILFVLGLFLLVGCSSRPTEEDGRKALEDEIDEMNSSSNGHIELVAFQKTNGEDGETENSAGMAVKSYSFQFYGTIKSIHRCALIPFKSKDLVGEFHLYEADDDTLAVLKKTENATIINPEEPQNIDGTIIFEKSEKGWRVNKVLITYP